MAEAKSNQPQGGTINPTPEDRTVAGTGTRLPTPGNPRGTNTGGLEAGGLSAADVTGGGAGGDLDNPDITGRGTTEDLLRGPPPGVDVPRAGGEQTITSAATDRGKQP